MYVLKQTKLENVILAQNISLMLFVAVPICVCPVCHNQCITGPIDCMH